MMVVSRIFAVDIGLKFTVLNWFTDLTTSEFWSFGKWTAHFLIQYVIIFVQYETINRTELSKAKNRKHITGGTRVGILALNSK